MARRPRLDMADFHHIVNRGVARDNVYKCDEDKEKYLGILYKSGDIIPIIKLISIVSLDFISFSCLWVLFVTALWQN